VGRRALIVVAVVAFSACGRFIEETSGAHTDSVEAGAEAGLEAGPPLSEETTVTVDPKPAITDSGLGDGPTVEGGVGDAASTKCSSARGPQMVELVFGATSYCIDSTEVTNEQYNAFVADPIKPPKHARCDFNTVYAPNCNSNNTKLANEPVNCIDWCDAWAFCAWADKRLCGKIGGGPNAFDDLNDATKSQWFAACSKGGTQDFCYGNTAKDVCQANQEPPAVVKSNAQCTGAYAGLFDLTGNLGEWEDSCVLGPTPQEDECRRRGGDIIDAFDFQHCSQGYGLPRAARQESGGFRCCR
jgi:formylglycine-generating enzyme